MHNGGAHCLVGVTRAQEITVTSLTRGWRMVEMLVTLAQQRRLWWQPLPGCVSGKEGDRNRVLQWSTGHDKGAYCLGRVGLDQETVVAITQHAVEAPNV